VTFKPPLALNPLPVADTLEMVTFAVPTSIRVTDCTVEFPTVKFPKFTVVELGESCEDVAG